MSYTDPLIYATLDRSELIAAIPTIPAGRILDGLIAREALRWDSVPGPTMDYDGPIVNGPILVPPGTSRDRIFTVLPPRGIIPWFYFAFQWSTTDRDMLHLMRELELRKVDYQLQHSQAGTLQASVNGWQGVGDTKALAFARAALLWGCHAPRP